MVKSPLPPALRLYAWKKRFEAYGLGGLMDRAKGKTGSRWPDFTKRSILILKQAHPDHGRRIKDLLLRGPRADRHLEDRAGADQSVMRRRPVPKTHVRWECTHTEN